MGKTRRGGFIFEWWIGDHPPRHIHVSDSNGELLGRIVIENMTPLEDWKPPRKVLEINRQLIDENRL
jgi:hypothetical protein